MPRGQRRIKLAKTGHYAWYGTVEVGAEGQTIQTHLVPVP